MVVLLLDLIDKLAKGIHKIKCIVTVLEYESAKDNLIKYKYISCNRVTRK